jgi:hypothetical protein
MISNAIDTVEHVRAHSGGNSQRPAPSWAGNTCVIRYDLGEYAFAAVVADHLNVRDLSRCHELVEYALFTRETDQRTVFHRRFYGIGNRFFEIYGRFVKRVAEPFIGEPVVYQRIPTFRVHLPENVGVGEFHRDRDYNHQPSEINFWLPLTDAWDSNSIYIESAEGREDYQPQAVRYGEVLVFDGANLKHGNHVNRTGCTRVSFDFRVIPKSRYVDSDRTSVNTNVPFKVGGYFTV